MIDFDALLAPAMQSAFGQEASYRRKTPVLAESVTTELTITAIFDFSESVQSRTGGSGEAWVRDSDFGDIPPVKGDVIVLGDASYSVVDVRPNSTQPAAEGARVLELRKAPVIA